MNDIGSICTWETLEGGSFHTSCGEFVDYLPLEHPHLAKPMEFCFHCGKPHQHNKVVAHRSERVMRDGVCVGQKLAPARNPYVMHDSLEVEGKLVTIEGTHCIQRITLFIGDPHTIKIDENAIVFCIKATGQPQFVIVFDPHSMPTILIGHATYRVFSDQFREDTAAPKSKKPAF